MIQRFAILLGVVLSAGCASIDFDYPKTESHTITATDDTTLARDIRAEIPVYPEGQSGFYPMGDGVDALATRLLLAKRAEKTIDVQYYLIKNDIVGREFFRVLLEAADRGVRVRLLLDDMFTSGYDVGMAALYSHPNFEIQIFNPFNRGTAGRAGSAVTSFGRINRRMHNKSFTVDNSITLIGGRNIADEYFGVREDAAFGDLDVLAIGPIVQEVSAMFDLYWNHEAALPVPAFVNDLDEPGAELDAIRDQLAAAQQEIAASEYAEAVAARIYDYIAEDASIFNWAPYRLVYDSPDKGIKHRAGREDLITAPLAQSLLSAQKEVIIISPYFVPMTPGIEFLTGLQERGVNVVVVTNSLAANNQFSVHSGYKPSRKPLLKSGIDILEVRPDAKVRGTEFIDASGATATLHTKAFIVDREQVFIGSFNFDPRSANLNTEMGVIIDDAELGGRLANALEENYQKAAYDVFLNEEGKVRWRGWNADGEEVIYDKEPETTAWTRFKVGLVGILPIKSQL